MKRNALHYVTVESTRLINESTILVVVDLTKHVHLYDPQVVVDAMDDFMVQYENLHSYEVRASGDYLYIMASGRITHLDIAL